jgi:hypothetical protein
MDRILHIETRVVGYGYDGHRQQAKPARRGKATVYTESVLPARRVGNALLEVEHDDDDDAMYDDDD